MDPKVAYSILYHDNAKKYSITNGTRIRRLRNEIRNFKQSKGMPMEFYYAKLIGLYDELLQLKPLYICECGKCTCDIASKLATDRNEEIFHQFLIGVDDDLYGSVRTDLLSRDPMPTLDEAYLAFIQEERSQEIARENASMPIFLRTNRDKPHQSQDMDKDKDTDTDKGTGISQSCRSQGEEKRILMLALSDEAWPLEKLQCGRQLYHIGRAEFHSVDLNHNILTRSCFPSIIMTTISRAMLSSLNKFMYLVGGGRSPDFQSSNESASSNLPFYYGGSCLDISAEAPVWCPAPVFLEDNTTPNFVSFFGNIYNFGSARLAPRVLDCGAHYKSICSLPIPQSLDGCSVSVPVIPDPSNKRILMRLYGGPLSSPSLYAFTPDADANAIGTWECLTPNFQLWAHCVAVVNGIIYFHCHKVPSLLCAFHMTKKIWLKVWWDSCFKDNNVDMNVDTLNFDAMLHLGDNILCFAGWTPIYPQPGGVSLEVIFYKFQLLVIGETVTVKACDCYLYELPGYTNVFHFLPV